MAKNKTQDLTNKEVYKYALAMAFLYLHGKCEIWPKYKTCHRLTIDDFYQEANVKGPLRSREKVLNVIKQADDLMEELLNKKKVELWFSN